MHSLKQTLVNSRESLQKVHVLVLVLLKPERLQLYYKETLSKTRILIIFYVSYSVSKNFKSTPILQNILHVCLWNQSKGIDKSKKIRLLFVHLLIFPFREVELNYKL